MTMQSVNIYSFLFVCSPCFVSVYEKVDAQDSEEAQAKEEDRARNWFAENEPAPVPIDTWARGAVPVRRKNVTAYPTEMLEGKMEGKGSDYYLQ